ncbi:major facilitator superfamily domain-containing protein [Bisporella sp. PMI_857]|nr:major facilitator superfamily domain-containing protein [Bisporella sp. PMI_857]
MADIIRDSSLGQVIRFVSRHKYLQYVEEHPDFELPGPVAELIDGKVKPDDAETSSVSDDSSSSSSIHSSSDIDANIDVEKAETHDLRPYFSRTTQAEAVGPERVESRPIVPTVTSDGVILVDWYTTDDPENPLNWSIAKRAFVSFQILIYTFAVYMGSSIYAPGIPGIMQRFGVSETAASLGLALYVFGYGIGPMLFSPLSEMPLIGRNPPYIATLAIFVVLIIPAALTQTFGGLLTARFLLGFFGSPALATGAATLQDMFRLIKIPYVLTFWAGAATFGPALGPIIGGFSAQARNWTWTQWEMIWIAGPVFLMMFAFLPETSSSNILLRRARRLRKVLNNPKLKAQSEIDQANMKLSTVTREALLIPWKINLLDPAVAFSTFYTALVYGIYYSFFESFPLVYVQMYNFNLGQSTLPFLSIAVSLAICLPLYNLYFYLFVERPFPVKGFGAPEQRLIPGLYGSYFIPIGLFIFAWTSRPSVHWIWPTIGAGVSVGGTFIVFQAIFLYLPFTYAQYSASLFAANDFARSTLAAAAILFARPLFHGLGVDGGVSLLAGLTVLCIGGIYILYFYGAWLRSRSKFAAK